MCVYECEQQTDTVCQMDSSRALKYILKSRGAIRDSVGRRKISLHGEDVQPAMQSQGIVRTEMNVAFRHFLPSLACRVCFFSSCPSRTPFCITLMCMSFLYMFLSRACMLVPMSENENSIKYRRYKKKENSLLNLKIVKSDRSIFV